MSSKKRRILRVEGDYDTCELITLLLGKEHYEKKSVSDELNAGAQERLLKMRIPIGSSKPSEASLMKSVTKSKMLRQCD